MLIEEIFVKDINRTIDGVIKADDNRHLEIEVDEYVLTPDIRKNLQTLLESYNEGGSINGVWISGFFGSGKSHLLKMISMLLENRKVGAVTVADAFSAKAKDDEFLVSEIRKAARVPAKSILFNIDQKAPAGSGDEAILHVFVNVFNELRGFDKTHGWIADLEASLEDHGHYEAFKAAFHAEMKSAPGKTWDALRGQAFVLFHSQFAKAYAKVSGVSDDEASRVLDRQSKSYKVSIESFAERVNGYIRRQPAGFRLNFFVDEVGQFIGDNNRRMLNLQTIAESLSTKCDGRAWIFVTSQGNLDSVIGEFNKTKGDDFTKIQGRFKTRINLTSKDVDQVICHRLLEKKDSARTALGSLYEKEKENLRTLFVFSDDMAKFPALRDSGDFVARYPFMPYQFQLFETVLKEFSNQNWFTGKHSSIGERSMLGVFQEVAKAIAKRPAGKLATFDIMFEGLRSVLRADLQTLIQQAEKSFGADSLEVRLLKVLFLVKHCKFSGKPRNLAVLLIDDCHIDIADHEKQVTKCLERLFSRLMIRRSGETFEFLTNEEKDLENEIRAVDISERDTDEYLAKTLWGDILPSTKLRYEHLGVDYEITRRIDDAPHGGREYDIGVHLLTPEHHATKNGTLLNSLSVEKPHELLIPVAFDARLLEDITQQRKTEKFISQNNSPSLPPAKQALFRVKASENNQLAADIRLRIAEALRKSPILLAGTEVDAGDSEPKARLARAFQSLVSTSFRNLRMIRAKVSEDDVRRALEAPTDELFSGNDATMPDAEAEVLRLLKEEKAKGRATTVKSICDTLEKRPYGWRNAIARRQLAGLIRRGKIELNIKTQPVSGSKALADALLNERTAAEAVVIVQEEYDASTVKRLKDFHFQLVNETNPGHDAAEVVSLFQSALRAKVESLRKANASAALFPFYGPVERFLGELEKLVTRDRDYYFTELPKRADDLLDAKEAVDPILEFEKGDQRAILTDIRKFLTDEATSLHSLDESKTKALRSLAESNTLPTGPTFVKAKATLRELRDELKAKIEDARSAALYAIAEQAESVRELEDFRALAVEEAARLVSEIRERFERELRVATSLFAIDRIAEDFRHRGMSDIASALHAKAHEQRHKYERPAKSAADFSEPVHEPKPAETLKVVSARKLRTGFSKPMLENLADLDAYLAALRVTYAAELKQQKRIQL